jgi:serine/threonine-protein kinase
MPLAIVIALVAAVPPRARIGAPIVTAWLVARVTALATAAYLDGTPAAAAWIDQLPGAAIDAPALALAVVAAHRAWRLHHDLYESRRLGRFRLMSPIGRGMNEVWLAWDEQRRREVALKLLRTPGAAEATRARFAREAECVRLLRSPHTTRIYDYGVTDDGFAYMALQYLRGLDLDALVTAYGPVEPGRALHLMIDAARGLAVAHARGIVHRDVKPANLHCADSHGAEDFVRILDFGVARSIGEPNLTLDGMIVGTPTYMAPEAFAAGEVSPAADVYSLGATFYFALTGQPPFDGDDVADLRAAHLHAPVVPPSLRSEHEIARPLENVILRCLAKEPADRYDNALELIQALDACADAVAPWSREKAARWWHRARVGRVPTVAPSTERTTEVEAVPVRS